VTVEVIGVSPLLEAHRREIGTMFALLIQAEAEALREAGQKIVGNQLTALALVAAVHELTASWLASPEPIEIDDLIAEAVRIITAVAVSS
jgi:hypothetical protein